MNELAQEIARKVVEDTKYFTAIIGLIGVIIGSIITIIGNILVQWLKHRAEYRKDEQRRNLLNKMLNDERFKGGWRTLDTLMHVIGSDQDTTKRLLIEIGARASEDGQDKWSLIKNNPLKTVKQ